MFLANATISTQHSLGVIAAYVLGVAGYIYAISAWTETKSSIYWLDDTQLSALGY